MSSAPTTTSTTTTSTGLYVPVHKRTGSSASSRSSSLARSEASVSSQRDTSPAPISPAAHPLIYSRDTLLGLMQSPLSRLPLDTRESLRAAFPVLVTNRRQRKSLEYHTHHYSQTQARAQVQAPTPTPTPTSLPAQPDHYVQSKSHPFVRVQPRRTRPIGRVPERRRNATKIVDEASWRGRRVVVVPIAV